VTPRARKIKDRGAAWWSKFFGDAAATRQLLIALTGALGIGSATLLKTSHDNQEHEAQVNTVRRFYSGRIARLQEQSDTLFAFRDSARVALAHEHRENVRLRELVAEAHPEAHRRSLGAVKKPDEAPPEDLDLEYVDEHQQTTTTNPVKKFLHWLKGG